MPILVGIEVAGLMDVVRLETLLGVQRTQGMFDDGKLSDSGERFSCRAFIAGGGGSFGQVAVLYGQDR